MRGVQNGHLLCSNIIKPTILATAKSMRNLAYKINQSKSFLNLFHAMAVQI